MLLAITSLKRSPGVTTLAVALAVRWPGDHRVVVVEADPSGGDLAPRFSLPGTPSTVSLAAEARRSTDSGVLWRHAQTLPSGVPVIVAPAGAEQACGALTALTDTTGAGGILAATAKSDDLVMIADCGRLDPGSAALPIVRAADSVLLVTRAGADDLAHLAARLPNLGGSCRGLGLVLIGDGYPPAEVSRELGRPVLAHIPEDPRTADALRGLRGGRRRAHRTPLGRGARRLACTITSDTPPRTDPDAARSTDATPADAKAETPVGAVRTSRNGDSA